MCFFRRMRLLTSKVEMTLDLHKRHTSITIQWQVVMYNLYL